MDDQQKTIVEEVRNDVRAIEDMKKRLRLEKSIDTAKVLMAMGGLSFLVTLIVFSNVGRSAGQPANPGVQIAWGVSALPLMIIFPFMLVYFVVAVLKYNKRYPDNRYVIKIIDIIIDIINVKRVKNKDGTAEERELLRLRKRIKILRTTLTAEVLMFILTMFIVFDFYNISDSRLVSPLYNIVHTIWVIIGWPLMIIFPIILTLFVLTVRRYKTQSREAKSGLSSETEKENSKLT